MLKDTFSVIFKRRATMFENQQNRLQKFLAVKSPFITDF